MLPTLTTLAGVPLPQGVAVDGRDLSQLFAGGEVAPHPTAVAAEGIRDERFALLLPDGRLYLDGDEASLADARLDREEGPEARRDVASLYPQEVLRLAEEYRRRLAPAWKRWQASERRRPLDGPVAIGADSFDLTPWASWLESLAPEELAAAPAGSGWLRFGGWPEFALVGTPRSGPIEVSFPFPDGRYRLRVGLHGRCRLRLGPGEPPLILEASPWEPPRFAPELVEAGTVEVTGKAFVATVEAAGAEGAWLLVRSIVLEPLDAATAPGVEDEERAERLRALGYL